ncbi:MAG: AcrR family transcriptional regulator [Granulosicoccus sp.]|jgi:AcrR family transcriptional regulator
MQIALMNKTKKKIILSAVKLFNQVGLANARNQDIAEQAGVSLSNFNYHFKTKKDLVLEVMTYMKEVLEENVYGNKLLIQDGQGLEIAKSYYEFEEEFQFFYLDTHNIIQTYPELKAGLEIQINESIQMIKNLNYMGVGMGLMKPEPTEMPGLYDQLAQQIWINNHFWFAQMKIRGLEGSVVVKGLEAGFGIVYPYLTEKGIAAYRKFIDGVKAEQN